MFDYYSLHARNIKSIFPNCLPCNCYDSEKSTGKIPRYNVKVVYGTLPYSDEKIIKEIGIQCGCCNTYKFFNVENWQVSTNSLHW